MAKSTTDADHATEDENREGEQPPPPPLVENDTSVYDVSLPENGPREYFCWDYHVFVVRSKFGKRRSRDESEGGAAVRPREAEGLDVDTWLPYPC